MNQVKNQLPKQSPYGLTQDEVKDMETLFLHPGWAALIKKVYPKIREGLVNAILSRGKTNDEINELRGELRALNDYINAPMVAFKIKKD